MEWSRKPKVFWVVAGVALIIGVVCSSADLPAMWTLLTGNNGEDGALAIGDQIASIGSFLLTAVSVWLAISLQRGSRAVTAATAAVVRRAVTSFLDRKRERRQLRNALRCPWSRIIVVTGPAGAGKTELVRRVLDDLRILPMLDVAPPLIHPSIEEMVRALDAAGGFPTGAALRDESALGRLEGALERLGPRRAVLVIDSVEQLQDDEDRLRDISLDEALETLATSPRHGVKVVLVTQRDALQAHAGGNWSNKARVVPVGGLPLDYFRAFVQENAKPDGHGLASLDDRTFIAVYQALDGKPRLAQIFDAIVDNSDLGAISLAGIVRGWAGQRAPKVTSGSTVIVTRNEVEWARTYSGDCILGILSDVTFLPNGEIDAASGTFRVFTWNPDGGALAPRAYDFEPDAGDRIE